MIEHFGMKDYLSIIELVRGLQKWTIRNNGNNHITLLRIIAK